MSCVVADASPLIALARIGGLNLLRDLYEEVLVPARVYAELQVDGDRPGARSLHAAWAAGWLKVVETGADLETLRAIPLDLGEAEAIWFAEQHQNLRFLLIDERRGRQLARQRGLPVVGTGGVLLVAKQAGLVADVRSLLDKLSETGYYLSPQLCNEILRLAGEK